MTPTRCGDNDQQEQVEANHPKNHDGRLDASGEASGRWGAGSIDGHAAAGGITVAVPEEPPMLHPAAAAALLTLLRHTHRRRRGEKET